MVWIYASLRGVLVSVLKIKYSEHVIFPIRTHAHVLTPNVALINNLKGFAALIGIGIGLSVLYDKVISQCCLPFE